MPRKLFGTYIGSQMGGKFVVGAEFVIPALQKFVNNILHRAVPAGFLCLRPDVVNCQIRIFCVFSEPFSLLLIIFKDFMHRLNCKTVWSTDDGAEPFCRSYPRNAAELLHNFEKRRFSDTDVPPKEKPLADVVFPGRIHNTPSEDVVVQRSVAFGNAECFSHCLSACYKLPFKFILSHRAANRSPGRCNLCGNRLTESRANCCFHFHYLS